MKFHDMNSNLRFTERITRIMQMTVILFVLGMLVMPTSAQQVKPSNQIPISPLSLHHSPFARPHWIELGKCKIDYTAFLPDGLEEWVDNQISGDWSNELDPHHPNVYLKVFSDSTESEQIGSTIYRGFFAQGNSWWDWVQKMRAWFLQNKKIVYINGDVLDRSPSGTCSPSHRWFEWERGWLLTLAGWAKLRFEQSSSKWSSDYHLFVRNCQHFSDWVLTGIDNSR